MSIIITDEAIHQFSQKLYAQVHIAEASAVKAAEDAVQNLKDMCEADRDNRGYHLVFAQGNLDKVASCLQLASALSRQSEFVCKLLGKGRKANPLEQLADCAE